MRCQIELAHHVVTHSSSRTPIATVVNANSDMGLYQFPSWSMAIQSAPCIPRDFDPHTLSKHEQVCSVKIKFL